MSAIEVDYATWNTASVKYGTPKINKVGGKSINIMNPTTNRFLQVVFPTMGTWGISDFVNKETNESDGKFKISLIFPTGDYATPETDLALQKMKDFEAQLLEDAAKNSELWWGEPMSKDILKHMLFPTLKYQKDPKTKKIDYSKDASISAKVVNYGEKWNVEIYDTQYNRLFPCDNPDVTPMDLVVKFSKVNCILECGGIWIGGKGWGVTWKLVECVVKPRDEYKSTGRCRIKLSDSDIAKFEEPAEEVVLPPVVAKSVPVAKAVENTIVEDSDNEEPEPEPEPEKVVEPQVEDEPEPVAKKVVKKVVKKIVTK
uniref:Uncharacterized protein n=1 Tax=viral metagenome TaxID=1070528 RepID=A0A6C0HZD0_9ZZZZ